MNAQGDDLADLKGYRNVDIIYRRLVLVPRSRQGSEKPRFFFKKAQPTGFYLVLGFSDFFI